MPARRSWPCVLDVVGPRTPGLIQNRLSVLQVETVVEGAREGMSVADLAEVASADPADVAACLERRGLIEVAS